MSKLYKLTKEIHAEIDRIRAVNEGIGEIEGDLAYFNVKPLIKKNVYKNICIKRPTRLLDSSLGEYYILSSKSIKTLLRDLHNAGLLGENPEIEDWKKQQKMVQVDLSIEEYSKALCQYHQVEGNIMMLPKALALALSTKWFNDIESEEELLPSLWDSKGGKEKVLSELWEVLKGIK